MFDFCKPVTYSNTTVSVTGSYIVVTSDKSKLVHMCRICKNEPHLTLKMILTYSPLVYRILLDCINEKILVLLTVVSTSVTIVSMHYSRRVL